MTGVRFLVDPPSLPRTWSPEEVMAGLCWLLASGRLRIRRRRLRVTLGSRALVRVRVKTSCTSAPGRPSTPPSAAGGQSLSQALRHQGPANLLPAKEEQLGPAPTVSTAVPAVVPEATSHSPSCSLDLQPSPGAELPPLGSNASAQQTAQWLQAHRFTSHLQIFASFCGADLLRLTREDLMQICGLPDGIRLHNALHSKAIAPRLTLYLRMEQSSCYHALYLDTLSCSELASKLAHIVCLSPSHLEDVLLQGPTGIHVFVTDDVVRNIRDEAMFSLEVLRDPLTDQYKLLLKTIQR